MSSSQKATAFKTAVTSLINTLIGNHDDSNSAHNSLFNAKSDTGHKHAKADITDFPTSMTPASHTHGSITNDGKIGTTANKPIITGTNGVLQAGSFESTATNIKMNGTQAVGSSNNFARSDHVHPVDTSRAASSHTHGGITNDGKIGTTANKPIITGTNGVLQAGSFGTAANTFCQGNDSRLSNARTPTSHAVNANTYGLGTTGVYGHVKTVNGLTQSSHSDGLALSAYQGYLLDQKISTLSGGVSGTKRYEIKTYLVSGSGSSATFAETYNFDINDTVFIMILAYDLLGNQVELSQSEASNLQLKIIDGDGNKSTVNPTQGKLNSESTLNGAIYTYTPTTWGECMFSVETYTTHINVTGWKTVVPYNGNYMIRVLNDELVEYILSTEGTVNATTSVQTLNGWIPSDYIPLNNISVPCSQKVIFVTFRADGAVGYYTITGSSTNNLTAVGYWAKR